jgi:hypothetical protein
MNTEAKFDINNANLSELKDYALYCDDKVNMGEMPMSYEDFRIANLEMDNSESN